MSKLLEIIYATAHFMEIMIFVGLVMALLAVTIVGMCYLADEVIH